MEAAGSNPSSTGVDFGRGNRFRDVNISGTVAGRDIHQGVSPADAEAVEDRRRLLDLLERVEAAVQQLSEAPAGEREDVQDELRKAKQAAQQGDDDRLTKKLQGAQSILERLGENLPAAIALAQTVGVLARKAAGLG